MRSTRWIPRIGMAGVVAACLVVVGLVDAGEASATAAIWRPGDGPSFRFGSRGDWPVPGDWDGDHKDDLGVFRGNTFYLRSVSAPPYRTTAFRFGRVGDMPIAGDWDGDGVDTVGVFRRGVFYLRNSNSTGPADEVVRFGLAAAGVDLPRAGDWDGDGKDELAVYRWDPITTYVRNRGLVRFGVHGADTFTGDWNGDGKTTFAARFGDVYLTNTTCDPTCPERFRNDAVRHDGLPTDVPFGADFDGDGRDEVGIVETMYPIPTRDPEHISCEYFENRREAQAYFDYWYPLFRWFFDGAWPGADPHLALDPDRDHVACELLPTR